MGVRTVSSEATVALPAERAFKASVVEAQDLLPKLLPDLIKNVQVVGNGGPGSIQQLSIAAGGQIKHLKNRIDAIDTENLTYSYSVIEGDGVPEKFESISHEIKFEPISETSCKGKHVIKYHSKPGVEIKEEDLKAAKEEGLAMLKAVEAYLVANP